MNNLLLIQIGARDPLATDPLGIESIAGHLAGACWEGRTELIDEVALLPEIELESVLPEAPPHVVGLSAMWPNLAHINQTTQTVRRRYPDAKIVLGGSAVAAFGPVVLEDIGAADLAVVGEGEDAMLAILSDEPVETIPNLVYREDGRILSAIGRQGVPHRLGPPDRSLFRGAATKSVPYVAANMELSRGCDYGACTFCHLTSEATRHRAIGIGKYERYRVAPEDIAWLDYLELLKLGVERINFSDEEMFGGRGVPMMSSGARFLHRVIDTQLGIDVRKKIFARSPDITKETVHLMLDSGVNSVFVGVESGSAEQLKIFGKGAELQTSRSAIEMLRLAGIRLKAGFIMFHPLSTWDQILDNIDFIREMNLHANVKNPMSMMDVIQGSAYHRIALRRTPDTLGDQGPRDYVVPWRPADSRMSDVWGTLVEVANACERSSDRIRADRTSVEHGRLSGPIEQAVAANHARVLDWLEAVARSSRVGLAWTGSVAESGRALVAELESSVTEFAR